MISHHPRLSLIHAHAEGALPATLSVAIAAHCQLCEQCQTALHEHEQVIASRLFHNDELSLESFSDDVPDELVLSVCQEITCLPLQPPLKDEPHFICIKEHSYPLPLALQSLSASGWTSLGNISRMRYDVEESAGRASLLHISAGGSVPTHTHKGYELTLLLEGSFSDETGEFSKGDFIERDASHEHSPFSKEGCLCYTLVDAPLHFTKGLGKLLNPFGQLLY